jgi:hypothetical protein
MKPINIANPALNDPFLEDIEGAHDALLEVVEVVRDAAGQLSNGFHFLALPQRLFRCMSWLVRSDTRPSRVAFISSRACAAAFWSSISVLLPTQRVIASCAPPALRF